jgi:flavin reductase (DIM6/NTAB) family NADH-FMN oxidoreductase RutF
MDLSACTLFDCLDPPLWLVTAQAGARRGGLIATFVNEASIVPDLPRMLVGLARQHHTWELVEASGAFALHLLSTDQVDLVYRFGMCSGREVDKLAGLRSHTGATGSPLLEEALGWLDCRVEARLDTGDRTVYLAEVVQSRVSRLAPPLTFRRLLEQAPAEGVAELKRQRHADSLMDAEAIRTWRERVEGKAMGRG